MEPAEGLEKMSVLINDDLKILITRGKAQGFLTYNEVSKHLPDETTGSEKLDALIAALEGSGIELCDYTRGVEQSGIRYRYRSVSSRREIASSQRRPDPHVP